MNHNIVVMSHWTVSTLESWMTLGVVWILFRISSLPRELVVASLFPCVVPKSWWVTSWFIWFVRPNTLSYRYKKAQFCKGRRKGKGKERKQARLDFWVWAAKSFSGIEDTTPVTWRLWPKRVQTDDRWRRLSFMSAHCWPQCWLCMGSNVTVLGVTPWVLCPLATASYAKTRDWSSHMCHPTEEWPRTTTLEA
jgi:hypothetical protein